MLRPLVGRVLLVAGRFGWPGGRGSAAAICGRRSSSSQTHLRPSCPERSFHGTARRGSDSQRSNPVYLSPPASCGPAAAPRRRQPPPHTSTELIRSLGVVSPRLQPTCSWEEFFLGTPPPRHDCPPHDNTYSWEVRLHSFNALRQTKPRPAADSAARRFTRTEDPTPVPPRKVLEGQRPAGHDPEEEGWTTVHRRRTTSWRNGRPAQHLDGRRSSSLRRPCSDALAAFTRATVGRCFKCLSRDHYAAACRDPFRCFHCRRSGHRERDCPDTHRRRRATPPPAPAPSPTSRRDSWPSENNRHQVPSPMPRRPATSQRPLSDAQRAFLRATVG